MLQRAVGCLWDGPAAVHVAPEALSGPA